MHAHHPGALKLLGPAQLRDALGTTPPLTSSAALRRALDAYSEHPSTVFFVAKKAYFNQIRMSVALRRRGWTTVAVVLDPLLEAHNHGFFDAVVPAHLVDVLEWWSKSSGALIHTQGWLFRYHIPVLFEAYKPPKSYQIVEFMDLNRFMFPLADLDSLLPHMRAMWGDDCESNHRTQIACEQYLADNSDGLVFPGGIAHQTAFQLGDARSARAIEFLSYPLEDFFAPPFSRIPREPPRLVFAGGVPTSSARRIPSIFADAQLLSVIESIAGSGLPIDVYNNPLVAPADAYEEHYPEHLKLVARLPHFRFLVGDVPWEIVPTLADYDYGIMLYDFSGIVIGEQHFRNLIPTKLFLYLEAGLPVLVSERLAGVAEIVEQHGCGRVIEDGGLGQLPEILRGLDHAALRHKTVAAREALAMDGQIDRLIALYASVRGGS